MTNHCVCVCVCCILIKDLTVFCLYPEILSDAEFKSNRLSGQAEKFSRPGNIQAPVLPLLIEFIQIYLVKE